MPSTGGVPGPALTTTRNELGGVEVVERGRRAVLLHPGLCGSPGEVEEALWHVRGTKQEYRSSIANGTAARRELVCRVSEGLRPATGRSG
jgi:hypothetical protein